MDNSDWEAGAPARNPAPGFFFRSVPGLLGSPSSPTPGSPPLPSRAGRLVSPSPSRASLLALGRKMSPPSSWKMQGKDAKQSSSAIMGLERGCVKKGRRTGAAALTPLPRGQVASPRAWEVPPLAPLGAPDLAPT